MKCKYCQAELQSNSSVCPKCGKDNLKDELKGLKIAALSLVCLVMVLLLGGMISYGTTGSFIPDWLIVTEEEKFQASMDKVIATMGDHKLTNRQFQIYYWETVMSAEGDFDVEKDLSTQIKDAETGETWETYFREQALDSWKSLMLMNDAAKKAGYTMSEQNQLSLESMKSQLEYQAMTYGMTLDQYIQYFYGAGCNFDAYYEFACNSYYGGMYWSEMVSKLEVTEEQIENYFKEHEQELKDSPDMSVTKDAGNFVSLRNIFLSIGFKEIESEDGEKVKVEDWETCKNDAQKILDEWLSGEKTAEKFAELAKKYSKDTYTASKGGLYEGMYKNTFKDVDVRHILIMPQGATSATVTSQKFSDEAWAWAETKAKEILNQYLAGDKTEDAFAALAKEHSQDGNAKDGGLYTDVYLGQMVKEFENWCFDEARKFGDTEIVKTAYGYHVMFYVRADAELDNWCFDTDRKVGDYQMIKVDGGYQIIYIEKTEPIWHRVCFIGTQEKLGQEKLDALKEEATLDVDYNKIQIGAMPS